MNQLLAEIQADRLVFKEQKRQLKKWGVQDHNPFRWLAILLEEVGEFSQAALSDLYANGKHESHHEGMLKECVEVAAVAKSMVECLLRDDWRNKE